MSLEKWLEYGWIKAETSSPEEIKDLFGIVTRAINDAKVKAISDDLRFQAAFSAALTAANVALRASGYRTRVQTGHHQKIVESLELTLQSDPGLIQKMKGLLEKEECDQLRFGWQYLATRPRTSDPARARVAKERDGLVD